VVVMEGEGCIISLRLIAGLLARRIVFVPKEGDTLKRGERVGLIKFGSRCDLILPGDAHIRVERGQRVKGGESILADVEVPSFDPMLLKEVMETRP
jgi:phosphatidylserine decarboxylase